MDSLDLAMAGMRFCSPPPIAQQSLREIGPLFVMVSANAAAMSLLAYLAIVIAAVAGWLASAAWDMKPE